MNKIKIAIIGATGTAYKRTIPALTNSKVCEVVAVQGRNIAKLEKIQKEFQINGIYTDENEMLSKANFDCIYIGTPPFLHLLNIENAVRTLKPIICEKPLAIDYDNGLQISKLLNKYNEKTFMIAHHLRHQKAILDIKQLLKQEFIGEVLNVMLQWGFEMNLEAPSAIWKTNPKLGGKGTLSDNGIHIVDLANYFFGIPKLVYGKVESVRTQKTFDNETAMLIFDKLSIHLQSSQCIKYPGNHFLIYGSKGSIEVFNGIGEKSINKICTKSAKGSNEIEYESTNLYKNEVEDFCKCLIDSNASHQGTTLDEGLISLKIIDCIRNSAKLNAPFHFNNE